MSIQSGTSPGAIISAGNTPAPGGVISVFGRAGVVVAVNGDYTSSQITNLSDVVGATVTDALNTLNSITPSATQDIYMATTGNDANPGTIASPVLTLVGAYSKIHANATLPVIHAASGTYTWAPLPIPLTIIGDGAGQGADTGFTTVTTGVSAAGTTALQLVLAAPIAVNLYRGLTLEWRSGAANGHRLSVRDNTATIVTPVEVAGFPTTSIDPGVGSNFAIIRPSVIFTTAATEISGSVEIMDALNASREYTPAALVNVRMTMSSATVQGLIASSYVRMFGVEVNPGTFYLIDSAVDSGYVQPESAMNAWAIRVGLTGFAQITNWIGWCVTWPTAAITDQSWFINVLSVFRGMSVLSALTPSTFEAAGFVYGSINWYGGSALGDIDIRGGNWIQRNANITTTCRKLSIISGFAFFHRISCDAASTGVPMTLDFEAHVITQSALTLSGALGSGLVVQNGSRMEVLAAVRAFSATGDTASPGVLVSGQSQLIFSLASTVDIIGGERGLAVLNQSTVLCDRSIFTITANNNLRPAIDVSEDSEVTFTSNSTLVGTGTGGGARVRSNSRLTMQSSTFSLVASTNGPGVECSGGSQFYSPGGAGKTITGLGALGFGVNCRGGGQAYFLAAPTAVTGPAGDCTVGTGAGETQANAFFAPALSGIISALSGIVRAS